MSGPILFPLLAFIRRAHHDCEISKYSTEGLSSSVRDARLLCRRTTRLIEAVANCCLRRSIRTASAVYSFPVVPVMLPYYKRPSLLYHFEHSNSYSSYRMKGCHEIDFCPHSFIFRHNCRCHTFCNACTTSHLCEAAHKHTPLEAYLMKLLLTPGLFGPHTDELYR